MSLKVYTAYKLDGKKHDIWEFIRKVKPLAIGQLRKRLMVHYGIMMRSDGYTNTIKKKLNIPNDRDVTLMNCARYMDMEYREQASSSQRSPYDLDTGIRIMEYKGDYYMIPYAGDGCSQILDFLKNLPELQEYGYWNNSDMPEEITDREWEERGVVWDHLTESIEWDNYLWLEVCSAQGLYRINYPMNIKQWEEYGAELRREACGTGGASED